MERCTMITTHRWVVSFADADETNRNLLGGKGAGLAAMSGIGLPVPPGFTITTEACRAYYDSGGIVPAAVWDETEDAIADLERRTGRGFGDAERPLLVSVRSGSPVSMPGMMDTILDLGLNPSTVRGLALRSGEEFAWDAYRRLVQMYGDVVLGVDRAVLHDIPADRLVENDTSPDATVNSLQRRIEREVGQRVPDDPHEQLRASVVAVFESWMNKRAVDYRAVEGIADDLFTAVNVQAMVFGNAGATSGTGVVFTRNPTNGDPGLWGEYLENAQGEDIVAGTRTPQPIDRLRQTQPLVFEQLVEASELLERYNTDMQDIEFTVEEGALWMLQTRSAKRSGRCSVRCAVDMVNEGLIDRTEAVRRVSSGDLDELLHPVVRSVEGSVVLTTGLAASPGGASGAAVFTADEAERLAGEGIDVILVRTETSPDDFHGMVASQGIVTARGGMTSHAAVVARGMGKCCVAGCRDLVVDPVARTLTSDGVTVGEGEPITVDGSNGVVYLGALPTVEPQQDGYFETVMGWADKIRRLGVRANADTPDDARVARAFGAEGIGLCRTEHMFFGEERIAAVRRMIMASTPEERTDALKEIEPFQTEDFEQIFRAMAGLPVTIRLLDPPLHEFLPNRKGAASHIDELERRLAVSEVPLARHRLEEEIAELRTMLVQIDRLSEINPMLGHRGCRLGVSYPEITEMQSRAILRAAVACAADGVTVYPEIMIPLVGFVAEYEHQKAIVDRVANEVFDEVGLCVRYKLGSMIELPRAALTADQIALNAEFLSFGTNDLTQTTLGMSRDDSARFLSEYEEFGIVGANPFATIDEAGVGSLVTTGVSLSRSANPTIKIGVCGEHGGDPTSVRFFEQLDIDYVSCSPYRVPISRLSAAHAVIDKLG